MANTTLAAPLPGRARIATAIPTVWMTRSDPPPPEPPPPPPPEPPPPPPEAIGDPRVSHELGLTGGRLDTDEGLSVAVMCSLFSDARIDEAEARSRGIDDRRGYWADAFSASGPWGSTIWALSRAGVTQETALLVEGRAKEALEWLIPAGIAASIEAAAVAVESALCPRIELALRIRRPSAAGSTTPPLWERFYVL